MLTRPTAEVPSILRSPASLHAERCRDFSPAPAWRALQSVEKDSLALLHHPSQGLQGLQFKNFPIHAEFKAGAHGWERNCCEASSAVPCLDSGLHHALSGTRSFLVGTFFFASFSSFPSTLIFLLFWNPQLLRSCQGLARSLCFPILSPFLSDKLLPPWIGEKKEPREKRKKKTKCPGGTWLWPTNLAEKMLRH